MTEARPTYALVSQTSLIEAIQKADDGNFLRALAETVLQIIMDTDVEALIGAGRQMRAA